MNSKDFSSLWKHDLQGMLDTLPVFVQNMEHISKKDNSFLDRTYVEWIETWLAWSELSSTNDIKTQYDPFDNVEDELLEE
jgi:hypothetical protein